MRRVGLADRHAGLDRRHRPEQVGAVELAAVVGVRVGQRQRARLVDHRRRVAVGDAGELVARVVGVEVGLVRDLAQVEVEDVAPVLPRGRAEVDVAAHPARPRERRVQVLERDVAGPDEVDLFLARPGRLQPQPQPADPRRDDVDRVQERVEPARPEALHQRRVVDAVHHHQQLVEREPAATAHAARDHEVAHGVGGLDHERRVRRRAGAPRASRTASRARPRSRARGRRWWSARRRAP